MFAFIYCSFLTSITPLINSSIEINFINYNKIIKHTIFHDKFNTKRHYLHQQYRNALIFSRFHYYPYYHNTLSFYFSPFKNYSPQKKIFFKGSSTQNYQNRNENKYLTEHKVKILFLKFEKSNNYCYYFKYQNNTIILYPNWLNIQSEKKDFFYSYEQLKELKKLSLGQNIQVSIKQENNQYAIINIETLQPPQITSKQFSSSFDQQGILYAKLIKKTSNYIIVKLSNNSERTFYFTNNPQIINIIETCTSNEKLKIKWGLKNDQHHIITIKQTF